MDTRRLTDERLQVIADELAAGDWACFPADGFEVESMARELKSLRSDAAELARELNSIVKFGGGHGSEHYDALVEYWARKRAVKLLSRPTVVELMKEKD